MTEIRDPRAMNAGALNSLRAATHWMSAQELVRRYSEIDVNPDVLYVDNGNVLTSAEEPLGWICASAWCDAIPAPRPRRRVLEWR